MAWGRSAKATRGPGERANRTAWRAEGRENRQEGIRSCPQRSQICWGCQVSTDHSRAKDQVRVYPYEPEAPCPKSVSFMAVVFSSLKNRALVDKWSTRNFRNLNPEDYPLKVIKEVLKMWYFHSGSSILCRHRRHRRRRSNRIPWKTRVTSVSCQPSENA